MPGGAAPRTSRPRSRLSSAQRPRDLLDAIRLDQVAYFDVVEILDADAALEPFADFAHVVLEALERRQRAVVGFDAVANHADAPRARDDPAAHEAARDRADLGDLEDLPHLGLAQHHFLLLGREQAFHRQLHLFDGLVDDAVGPDLHALAVGCGARVRIGTHVEADDDRARRAREQHVGFRDRADAAVDDLDLHFRRRELRQRVGQRFGRAALVGLDDDPQRGDAAGGRFGHEVFQRLHPAGAAVLRFALETLALLRDVPRGRRVVHGEEAVARLRHALETEDLDRRGRADFAFGAAALVVHRAHAPRVLAADEVVADLQRAVLDEDRGDRALAGIERRFEH